MDYSLTVTVFIRLGLAIRVQVERLISDPYHCGT